MAFRVHVEGLVEMRKKCDNGGQPLIAPPYRRAMERTGLAGEKAADGGSPRDSGRLATSNGHKVQAGELPRYVAIKNTAKRGRVSYASILNFAPKWGHIGWFTRSVQGIKSDIDSLLGEAGREVERSWSK